jgi:magnesium chelatase subunit ChlD-like protein
MLESGAASTAKGIAHAIAGHATACGARLGLISFGGTAARHASSSSGPLVDAISALAVGGGTPLRSALELALEIEEHAASPHAALEPRWFVLTDGRSRERVHHLAPRSASRALVVIDCELGPLRLGRARGLATTLGGAYTHAETLLCASDSGSPPARRRTRRA